MIGTRLRHELERHFEVVSARSAGDEVVIVCPVSSCHDQTGNRGVNLKTGLTGCWRCGRGGHVSWLFSLVGVDLEDAEAGTVDETLALIDRETSRPAIEVISEVALPRGFTPLSPGRDSVYIRQIEKMARRKNLNLEDLIEAGAGFTRVEPAWEPFVIFPVAEWGKIVYYQGRLYNEKPGVKTKRFPPRSQVPLSSRYWLYNLDKARSGQVRVVIVVEAILSVLSLRRRLRELGITGVVPVASFSHHLSSVQVKKLASSGVGEICLMFDADSSAHALKSASRLLGASRATVAMLDKRYGPRFDPNDGVDVALEAFSRRVAFDPAIEVGSLVGVLS